jgi:hypothetical protein
VSSRLVSSRLVSSRLVSSRLVSSRLVSSRLSRLICFLVASISLTVVVVVVITLTLTLVLVLVLSVVVVLILTLTLTVVLVLIVTVRTNIRTRSIIRELVIVTLRVGCIELILIQNKDFSEVAVDVLGELVQTHGGSLREDTLSDRGHDDAGHLGCAVVEHVLDFINGDYVVVVGVDVLELLLDPLVLVVLLPLFLLDGLLDGRLALVAVAALRHAHFGTLSVVVVDADALVLGLVHADALPLPALGQLVFALPALFAGRGLGAQGGDDAVFQVVLFGEDVLVACI